MKKLQNNSTNIHTNKFILTQKIYMKLILKIAAVYNILWGLWVGLFPNQFFELVGMAQPTHPTIWQGMGMVIGVFGLGYWWASYSPMRHWPIVAVGFLGKIFGPLGFFINYFRGEIEFGFFYTLITNDFIWWIPFGYILWKVHKDYKWRLIE
jgi:hypothetical protein